MDEQPDEQQPKKPALSEPVIIKPQTSGTLEISHDDNPPAEQSAPVDQAQKNTSAISPEQIEQAEKPEPPPPQPTEPPKQQSVPQPAQEENSINQLQYQSGELIQQGVITDAAKPNNSTPADSETTEDSIKWNASEFVSHQKTGGWYVILAVGAVILAVAVYFLTKDIFSVVVIGLIALVVGFLAAMRPRILDYAISPDGIQVGNKHFTYETFRSFSVIEDSQMPSVQLLPQKRFMIPITMYFAPADGDHIVKVLGDYLPFEHRERDLVDKISSKIRF
jgi:hypothetical protein